MSETDTATQGGAATPAEPAATEAEAPAPAEHGAASEAETEAPSSRPSREDRRWAALSAKFSAAVQEKGRLEAEVEALRQRAAPPPADEPHLTPEQQAVVNRRVQAELVNARVQDSVERFHEQGRAAYGAKDWQERCANLVSMGADAGLAALLVDTPDGTRVAAALADDPEALEGIAAIKTERGRAIALGKYAATLGDKAPPASRAVSRAPAPIRPIGGNANTSPNEYVMKSENLVEMYSKNPNLLRSR
jgi:hypothetical protein